MTSIYTLVPDIYEQVQKKNGWFTNTLADSFATDVSKRLSAQLNETQRSSTLRLSKMGPTCPRALWYSVHHPELAEPFPPWVEIKLAYGHMVEVLAITLSKAAGHEVVGEQDEVILDGVKGHRDCIIDGCLVDIKSTNSIMFKKLKMGQTDDLDNFGYLSQLDGYVTASLSDPLLKIKDRGYDLFVDKTLGKLHLHEHQIREQYIRERVSAYKRIVEKDKPPTCECGVISIGMSGNVALNPRASYSAYKHQCFPGLRTFIYSEGPAYLVHVAREPDVTEIDRFGNKVER